MYNKLLAISLLLLLFTKVSAQTSEGEVVGSAESSFYNQSIEATNKIEIFPNPAVDYLVIQISNSDLNNTAFEMHSIIGNKMKIEPEEIGIGRYRIPVKEFATGYYFLVVKDEHARFKKAYKFLKN